MKSLQGYLLIASHKMADPNFSRSVVFIVQHNEQGALGLLINRPLDISLDDVWQQVCDTPCIHNAPLHQGGPCEGTLMALHADPSLSQLEVIPGVYFSSDKDDIQRLVASEEDDSPAKFFVGYAGWGPGQLEGELEAGAWMTMPAKTQHIFDADADLWNILRRQVTIQATWPWIRPDLIPDDPTVN